MADRRNDTAIFPDLGSNGLEPLRIRVVNQGGMPSRRKEETVLGGVDVTRLE